MKTVWNCTDDDCHHGFIEKPTGDPPLIKTNCPKCGAPMEAMVRGFSMTDFMHEVGRWSTENFGEGPYWHKFLGVVEEVGELAHCLLKKEQGIRGSAEEHDLKGQDAVGDIMVYLADFCYRMDWDFETITAQTWEKVAQRDWKKDPEKGGDLDG